MSSFAVLYRDGKRTVRTERQIREALENAGPRVRSHIFLDRNETIRIRVLRIHGERYMVQVVYKNEHKPTVTNVRGDRIAQAICEYSEELREAGEA